MKTAEAIGADLAGLIKGDVHVDIYTRTAFSTDASIYRIMPECVVAPEDTADIAAVVKYAAEHQIPIAPRGAGSGLAGEALTAGIAIDIRRFMDAILETAADGSWVRVQPGVVLETLNQHLSRWGRKIGPDPSSGNRAVIGGVVANNATGAHSLHYGYIADYVQSVEVVLADGTTARFNNAMEGGSDTPEGQLASDCLELLGSQLQLIRDAQPTTRRNRCGYMIQDIIDKNNVNLAKLMAGSEGTLGVFSEITLRTVPVPMAKGLVQFEFSDFSKMARAIGIIVDCGAATCELMDRNLIQMAREGFPEYHAILPEQCAATLLVEQTGDDSGTVHQKTEQTIAAVGDLASGHLVVTDPKQQALLWKSRKDAVPLLNRQIGPKQPIAFIEDVSVDHRKLDRYVAGLEEIGKRFDIPMAFYGHAGDGELHVRPYLDLSNMDDIHQMKDIAQSVFSLAWSLGGTVSGEHADGLLRAAFIEAQYGTEYYQLLKGIKKIFDPANILNPGKIMNDDPDIMIKNLRACQLQAAEGFETELEISPEEYAYQVQRCNGCGVCLAGTNGTRMCPIFRGMNEEVGSSRAKANLLANWMAGNFPQTPDEAGRLKDVLSLCVNCKMCSIECPAGVDISKIIIEGRTQLAHLTGFTVAELALSNNRWLSLFASAFSPVSNWVMGLSATRWAIEKVIGLDRTRRFPHFDRGSFIRKAQSYLKKHPSPASPTDKVVYFVDSYANWNDHDLGFAVLSVLEKIGVDVQIPRQRPVPLPAYAYGNIKTARRDVEYNLKHLIPYVRQGYKVICSEPSAALCLKEEILLIHDSQETRLIAENTFELIDYLKRFFEGSRQRIQFSAGQLSQEYAGKRIAYHAPCHLKSLRLAGTSLELLKRCGLEVTDIDGGCCGLAGTAGMQKKHHELSESIGGLLLEKIDACKPDIILTECAACKMQIEHLTAKPVLHPVKLLARAF